MKDQQSPRVRDRLTTIAVVPSALIAAATISDVAGGAEISRWMSSLIFVGLLLLYVGGTRPGRQSGVGSFLLGGLVILSFLAIGLSITTWSFDAGLDILEFLFMVGYTPQGGADAPLFAIGGIWWISLMFCIGLPVFLRSLVLLVVFGRTSLEDSAS